MNVPFLDVQAAYMELKEQIDAAIQGVLCNGVYIGGSYTEKFEEEFAHFCSAKHCIGAGNGLDALSLILEAFEIGVGDEVIVPAHTFIATWLSVTNRGAKVVPVDCDVSTRNIDIDLIESAITPRTKAIIPVHLYGQPADLDPMIDCARRNGLKLIEDAAQAQGASYKSRSIGAHGDAVAWSFYPGKNLGALGDAGAITTDDDDLALRVRRIANYGSSRKYEHLICGRNTRLDPLQAAVLSVKLSVLSEWNARRKALADIYLQKLLGLEITLPQIVPETDSAWHLFVVSTQKRQELQDVLTSAGIQTIIHYPTPPHLQPAYRDLGYRAGAFPVSEQLAETVLSLPIGPHLTSNNVDRICDVIQAWSWQGV